MGAFCVLIVIVAVVSMVCEELFSDFKYSSFLLKERREREKKIKRFEDLPEEEQQKIRDFEFRERARTMRLSYSSKSLDIDNLSYVYEHIENINKTYWETDGPEYRVLSCKYKDWRNDPVIHSEFKSNDLVSRATCYVSTITDKKLRFDLENFKSQFMNLPFFGLAIIKCPFYESIYLKDKEIENCFRKYVGSINYKGFEFGRFEENPLRDNFNMWHEIELKELCEKHNKKYDYDIFDIDDFHKKSQYLTIHLIREQEPGCYCWDEIDDEESKKQYLDTYSKLFLYFEQIRKEVLSKFTDELLDYYYKNQLKYISEINTFTYYDD